MFKGKEKILSNLNFNPCSKSSALESSPVKANAHNINKSKCHSINQLA